MGLVGGMGRGWRGGAGGTRGPAADADSADTDSAARPGPEGRRLATPASGALRACLLLMLNAWRVRREEARVLRQRVDQMRLQVGHHTGTADTIGETTQTRIYIYAHRVCELMRHIRNTLM